MAPHSAPGQRIPWSVAAALFLVTLAVYAPVLGHQFVSFDDQIYVTENPHVQGGLSWPALAWAFGTLRTGNWHPLTWLSHILDCQIYGMRPWGHHLTSALLHAANASLLFLVLRRLTAALWPSAAVAVLFALHPGHVESVAWVAERKDVLSGFFFLLTIYAYAGYAAKPGPAKYAAALSCFALGLMAKSMLVTLPFVLLLLDYWPLQRRAWLEKTPFFALSAATCWVTILAQGQAHAISETAHLPVSIRLENAVVSYWRYLGELVFPHRLAVFYPYENVSLEAATAGALALALILGVTIYNARRWPFLFVGFLWFVGMLLPVIGLVQVGSQGWADRYTYLPSIGFFIAVVWAAQKSLKYWALPIGMTLALATSLQLTHWKNTRTLFEHAAKVTQNNYMALALLGSVSDAEGKLEEARSYCEAALRVRPNYTPAHFFLGRIFEQQGRFDDAIAEYTLAVQLTPYFEEAHLFLGVAQVKNKAFAAAETNYLAALAIDQDSAPAHNDLGKLRQLQGRLDESRAEYAAALRLDPQLAQAHNNLGVILVQQGKTAEATVELQAAMRLSPTNTETVYNLIEALHQQNRWAEETQTLLQMAAAYSQIGQFSKASAVAEKALSFAQERGDTNGVRTAAEMQTAFREKKPYKSP